MKALDFVRTPKGSVAIVSETGPRNQVSITFLGDGNPNGERSAWWNASELTVIDSLPWLLARMTAHPMGDGRTAADSYHRPVELKSVV